MQAEPNSWKIVKTKQSTPKYSTPQDEYNLQPKRVEQQKQPAHSLTKRSYSKKFNAQSQLYLHLLQKLDAVQTKVEQVKMNIHRKNLQRMKRNVLRSQELQDLKRKYQQNPIQSQPQPQPQSDSPPYQPNQQHKIIPKLPQKENELFNFQPSTDQTSKDSKSQKQVSPSNLSESVSQQKTSVIRNAYKSSKVLNGLVTNIPESHHHLLETNPYSSGSSTYYVSEVLKGYKDKNSLVWEHLKTSIYLFNYFSQTRMPSNEEIKKRAVNLPIHPQYENKKTVIFDLDETLIHCVKNLKSQHQVELPITFPNGESITAGINIRPGATQILKNLHKDFELVVFTASQFYYANVVIDYLDPNKEYIQHRLYRDHCYQIPNSEYVKDLRIINRELRNMILVDNAAYSYAFQPQNGVPIIPYYRGDKDYQLQALTSYIQKLQPSPDVRVTNRQTFQLTKYRDFRINEVQKLVQDLYIQKKKL